MSNTQLFLDGQAKIRFEKMAAPIKLSDNVDNWQREVSSEIFKYLPFLSDYSVNVLIQRANPERGYAYGSAQVINKAENIESGQAKPVVIPIIIADRMLKPLDVFFCGDKAFPLSEERVREVLFDPRTFELSDRKPTDQGMVDNLYPPIRTNYGYGSGVTTGAAAGGAGFGKFASLSEAISSTITEEEAQSFVGRLVSDQQLAIALETNPAFMKAAAAIISAERVPVEKTAAALVRAIEPTVVQFIKLADGNFKIKWANATAFNPQEQTATPAEAQQMAGSDKIHAMAPGQAVTMGTTQAATPIDAPHIVPIQEFGQYQVRIEESGAEGTGWVLPVINFDSNPMNLLLFTDGQSYSLQDEMVGARVGNDISEIPTDAPRGDGAFFYAKSDGTAVALPPVTVQNQVTDPQGNAGYLCQNAFGEQITLHLTPGLVGVQKISDSEYAIPEDMLFTPLGQAIHVAKSLYNEGQVKMAKAFPRLAILRSTGFDEFHVEGMPFDKLATGKRAWLTSKDAEFLLVAAGMDQETAREKIAAASTGRRPIEIEGLNIITPLDHVHQDAVKQASAMLDKFPYELRRDLVKIAATLEDTETADNILALNFLNPENLSIFAGYLPSLNDSAEKLAEMLTASRMGLKQIDEGATERAMKNLDQVISGLKGLQQRELL